MTLTVRALTVRSLLSPLDLNRPRNPKAKETKIEKNTATINIFTVDTTFVFESPDDQL